MLMGSDVEMDELGRCKILIDRVKSRRRVTREAKMVYNDARDGGKYSGRMKINNILSHK